MLEKLDFALVKRFEFPLDNSDARCTAYCRLWIRFHMIVYLGNQLFYFCTVRGCNKVYNSRVTDGNSWVRNTRHSERNVKLGTHLAYISVFFWCSVGCCVLTFTEVFLDCFFCDFVLSPYRYPHSDTLSFLIFWVLASGPPSATFSHLIESMDHGKLNLFDVLDKYECWKGKCVKPVLGWFCSGVSICHNKGPQADMVGSF